MLNLVFFIIILGFVLLLVIVLSIVGFIRSLFGFGRRKQMQYADTEQTNRNQTQKSKIFTDNEGEYVDFEEVK